jgi:nitrate/nitrite-specific signal transduction histidine kinase
MHFNELAHSHLRRRSWLCLGASAVAWGHAPWARAQVTDILDAINKAGRQRMLSQRMAKAYVALVLNASTADARRVLDQSLAVFDRQLVELKAYAPNEAIVGTYARLEAEWSGFKSALVGKPPSMAGVAQVLALDARVLALAHQGTTQLEQSSNRSLGRLVNIAGRQRMLSQRLAKLYLSAAANVDAPTAQRDMATARTEFVAAMETLRNAPEATDRIKSTLQLGDAQWLFFVNALGQLQPGRPNERHLNDVFASSENLLTVMDQVTGFYASQRT